MKATRISTRLVPVVAGLAAVVAAGCATSPSPREIQLRREIGRTIPTCETEKECAIKWSAARNWIIQNSGWKLQHVQPDFLETYNAVNSSPRIAVRVTKEPLQDGRQRIVATVWCDNIFGCNPDKLEALQSFNNYVNSSWNSK